MNKTWLAMLGLLALVGLLLLAGCSKKTGEEQSSSPTSESKPPAASTPIDPITAATVSGTVKLDGTPPKPASSASRRKPAARGTTTPGKVARKAGTPAKVLAMVKK